MKYIRLLLVLTALCALVMGCSRSIDSKNPDRVVPESLPVPINVLASVGDQAIGLEWEIPDSSEVARFRIYMRETGTAAWILRDSTSGYNLTLNNVAPNRTYQLAVAAIFTSGLEGDRSVPVLAEVSTLAITIEEDAPAVNTREVLIQISAPGSTTHMKKYESGGAAEAKFILFSGTQTRFTLSAGDGLKTVYVELMFENGSQTLTPLTDDIMLDTRASISTVSFTPSDSTFVAGDVVSFSLDAGEIDGEASVVFGATEVSLDDGNLDGVYTYDWTVPTGLSLLGQVVTGRFTDAAGNQATLGSSQTLSIATPPVPVSLAATPLTSYQINLSWSEYSAGDFQSYRVYRDVTPLVTDASELIYVDNDAGSTGLVDDSLDELTTYHYAVYVVNQQGLSAASNVSSATTPANSAPTEVELVAIPDDTAKEVRLQWSQNSDADFASYRVYKSNSPGVSTSSTLVDFVSSQGTVSGTYSAPTGNTYFRVFVFDRQGLSTGSNEVQVTIP